MPLYLLLFQARRCFHIEQKARQIPAEQETQQPLTPKLPVVAASDAIFSTHH
jgi:hypothetical protein